MPRQDSRARRNSLESLEPRRLLSAGTVSPVWLSALRPAYSANGYGPVAMNGSNGEAAREDGSVITLGGKTYDSGIGVHADSELRFALGGKYRQFVTDIGVDDEVGGAGSVAFQVFADGDKLFDSGTMTGNAATRRVKLDLSDRKELRLVVTDAGDGNSFDHADWAGARLIPQLGERPVVKLDESSVTVTEPRPTLSITGRFEVPEGTDLGSWRASVDWGEGKPLQPVPMNDDGTFSLYRNFVRFKSTTNEARVYVSNGSATGVAPLSIKIVNNAPDFVGVGGADEDGNVHATAGFDFVGYGHFADDAKLRDGSRHVYAADFGDGSPVQSGTAGHLFFLKHVYETPGTYTLKTTVTDEAGNVGSGTNTIVVEPPAYTYVSELEPVELNVGAAPSRDVNRRNGGALVIDGLTYERGLGVKANSDLTYHLGGKFEQFAADVGVDDGAGASASVIFQVFADGAKVFDSGVMTSESKAQHVGVDLRGKQSVRLVVTDAGDGYTFDFADWGMARIG